MKSLPSLLLTLTLGCTTTTSVTTLTCDVALVVNATEASPGDTLTATGGPFTQTWDTRVTVGGVEAALIDLVRDDCTACDLCKIEAECVTCATCEDCQTTCESCDEHLDFRVPEVESGERMVQLINLHGTSDAVPLQVLAAVVDPPDTDVPDTDVPDPPDTDVPDTDTPDTDSP